MMNDLDPHRVTACYSRKPVRRLFHSLGGKHAGASSRDVSQVGSRYDLKQSFQCLFKNVDM